MASSSSHTPHLDLLPGEVLSCAPEYSLSDLFHLPHHDTFPTLCLPALHPNTDPHANLPPSHLLSLPTVTSSLNTAAWSFHLQDYPDRLFVDTIIHVINHGTNIGYHEDHNRSQACSNLRSSAENPAAVAADIVSQVTAGHTHGPFNALPLPFFRSLLQGAVTCKHQTKIHHIFHLSWPRGSSINDGIPNSKASIAYDMFHKVVQGLMSSGAGSLMVKLDLEQVFCQIPV